MRVISKTEAEDNGRALALVCLPDRRDSRRQVWLEVEWDYEEEKWSFADSGEVLDGYQVMLWLELPMKCLDPVVEL